MLKSKKAKMEVNYQGLTTEVIESQQVETEGGHTIDVEQS